MAISKRLRFEIFKRDSFTCRYCGEKSPKVILEVDHAIPRCNGGSDDEMNLVTSCFDCNRGKSGMNLSEKITGEDPHDKAIEVLERERQLAEYNSVMRLVEERVFSETTRLMEIFKFSEHFRIPIRSMLKTHSIYDVRNAFEISVAKVGYHSQACVPYCYGILRNWKNNPSKIS